jgi:hypothetical protein
MGDQPLKNGALLRRVGEMQAAHRALDNHIEQLLADGCRDQLELQRLKKQKLLIRDHIAVLERGLHPDIIA